jgi:hypothetical protein
MISYSFPDYLNESVLCPPASFHNLILIEIAMIEKVRKPKLCCLFRNRRLFWFCFLNIIADFDNAHCFSFHDFSPNIVRKFNILQRSFGLFRFLIFLWIDETCYKMWNTIYCIFSPNEIDLWKDEKIWLDHLFIKERFLFETSYEKFLINEKIWIEMCI